MMRTHHACAESLLAREQLSAALGAAREATLAGAEALARASRTEPHDAHDVEILFRDWGTSDARARDLAATWAAVRDAPVVEDDERIEQADIDRFERALTFCRHVDRTLRWVGQTRSERVAARVFAVAVAVIATSAFAVHAWIRAHRLEGVAVASAFFGNDRRFIPANVLDNNSATEWQLPDGAGGWLGVALPRVRSVHLVRLRNAHNGHYNDRATHAFRVMLYAKGRVLAAMDASFDSLDPRPGWIELPLHADGVDALRIVVLSHFGLGAGIADIDLR